MSVWTTPATWTAGAVTTAQMNTEVRDRMTWLKSALNLLTASSVSDTGAATYLDIVRASATVPVLRGRVSGDANPRLEFRADGRGAWGTGAAADIFLSRDDLTAAGYSTGLRVSRTSGKVHVRVISETTNGDNRGFQVVSANPANDILAALTADDRGRIELMGSVGGTISSITGIAGGGLLMAGGLWHVIDGPLYLGDVAAPPTASAFIQMANVNSSPATPAIDTIRLYAIIATGKMSLRVRWPSGTVTTLATEP